RRPPHVPWPSWSGCLRSCTTAGRSSRSSRPRGPTRGSVSAPAERLLYFALVGAIEAGLVRTAADALTVLRHARQPLAAMGAAWLKRQGRGAWSTRRSRQLDSERLFLATLDELARYVAISDDYA